MIDHYLKYQRKPETKTRFNLISHSIPIYESESFIPLLKPFIYAGKNPFIKASNERKSDVQISWNGKNLSSLYFFDLENPVMAYGDIYRTEDLILFIKENDLLEMFIIKNKLNHLQAVLDLWNNFELEEEINYFRENAKLFSIYTFCNTFCYTP